MDKRFFLLIPLVVVLAIVTQIKPDKPCSMACDGLLKITTEINVDDLFKENCQDGDFTLHIFDKDNTITYASDKITITDIKHFKSVSKKLLYEVTDKTSGNSCWGNITFTPSD